MDRQRNDCVGWIRRRLFERWREILRAIRSNTDPHTHSYGQPISHRDADRYFNANSNSYGYSHSQSNTDWNGNRNPYWNTDSNSNAK
jgi:hypothetical protein